MKRLAAFYSHTKIPHRLSSRGFGVGIYFVCSILVLTATADLRVYVAPGGGQMESTNSRLFCYPAANGGVMEGRNGILRLGQIYTIVPEAENPNPLPVPREPTPPPGDKLPGGEETITTTSTTTTTTTTTTLAQETITTTSTTTTTTTTITLAQEPPPVIKMYFSGQAYKQDLSSQLLIPKKPTINIEAELPASYSFDTKTSQFFLTVDEGKPVSKIYNLGAESGLKNKLSFQYAFPAELSEGEHTFTFFARTSGEKGAAANAVFTAKALVVGGPARIMDAPLTFPSPFSPMTKKEQVIIQYTLSEDADIDIYVFSISGELIKKFSCPAGSTGGLIGLNKVAWDGKLDTGMIGNGTYAGTIIAKKSGQLLGKFKLNVFD